jgi:hypothetical protein
MQVPHVLHPDLGRRRALPLAQVFHRHDELPPYGTPRIPVPQCAIHAGSVPDETGHSPAAFEISSSTTNRRSRHALDPDAEAGTTAPPAARRRPDRPRRPPQAAAEAAQAARHRGLALALAEVAGGFYFQANGCPDPRDDEGPLLPLDEPARHRDEGDRQGEPRPAARRAERAHGNGDRGLTCGWCDS